MKEWEDRQNGKENVKIEEGIKGMEEDGREGGQLEGWVDGRVKRSKDGRTVDD